MISSKNENIVYETLKLYGFNENLSRFATCQAAHETGDFTSFLFFQNHNCFGMKYAGQSTALGEKNGYAYYSGIEQSVLDFTIWWQKNRYNKITLSTIVVNTLPAYVQVLKNGNYFEADQAEYLRGCEYFYNKYFR